MYYIFKKICNLSKQLREQIKQHYCSAESIPAKQSFPIPFSFKLKKKSLISPVSKINFSTS